MKALYTLTLFLLVNFLNAQCSDLFFSEYVEGWSNNKALEIYNPTPNQIDLSAYSISRYTNGATTASIPQQLDGLIEPYSTFVIGLDKRDPNGSGFDAPVWDGFYTYTDSITNEEVTIYDADDDLQSMIDFWANGTYYSGTDPDSAATYPMTMFFNGNDAITLELIGGNVIDLIGKVGEDPGAGWTSADGEIWTKDHTLVRKSVVTSGVTSNPMTFDPSTEWELFDANTFTSLGSHSCECNSSSILETKLTAFSIYPNPSQNGYLNISNNEIIQHIKIYNNLGKQVYSGSNFDKSSLSIKIPGYGIHFVQLSDSQKTITKKVVLN